jgi:hypothetical protein
VVSPSPFLANPAISAFQDTSFFESSRIRLSGMHQVGPNKT